MLVPQLGFVILFVSNPLNSSTFYEKILELKLLEVSPTFALFGLHDGVSLGLWSSQTAEPAVLAKGGGSEIAFSEEDVDGLYRKWADQGVAMAQEPTDMDFGRTFVALDPDGHRIRVYRLKEEG